MLGQLQSKHPRRCQPINESLEGIATQHITVPLREALADLPKGAASGPSGMRNEYLRVLAKNFGGVAAKRVVDRLNGHAAMLVRGELPDWYYLLMSTTRLVPLVKKEAGDGMLGPEVRPVQVGEPLMTTIWKVFMKQAREALERILRPGDVFEAVEEFLLGLRTIGLMANVAKFEVWAPTANLQHIPPEHSEEGARLVDRAIDRALKKCLVTHAKRDQGVNHQRPPR